MATPDEASFEFIPDVGFRYRGDGRSVILGSTAITTAGTEFNDDQLFEFGSVIQGSLDTLNKQKNQTYLQDPILSLKSFRSYKSQYGFKFVTSETYDDYISKGSFLVSSLSRFRELEEQGDPAGDRFEGRAHSAYAVADRQLSVSTLSGFDTHIFSLARDLKNLKEMKSKFGPVVLRVELVPFARSLARLLGKGSFEIRLVRYADLKLYRGKLSLADVAGFPPNLTDRLAKALRENGRLPSIFAKPSRFDTEREVRIAIAASADVDDRTVVEDRNLLKFVERIDL